MAEQLKQDEIQAITKSLVRFSEQGWGLAFGSVAAFGLFFATLWLVVKGGINVGEHLNLLGVYLPGYSVSYVGSVIGFVYAFVIGYGAGRTIASVYNRFLPR
ncbi:MAG: hypothetical protein U0P30_06140 [Vicinamibacterales bacterium]